MKRVRCKYCNELTNMTQTKVCDNCWELEKRIKAAGSKLVIKIMAMIGMVS